MASYKTPGVYVQEISKLPASIAPVATAIPAFIGYTEKHQLKNGTGVNGVPVRIQSLLDYEEIFGGPYNEKFTVTLTDDPAHGSLPLISVAETAPGLSSFVLYYQLQLYFSNGGGPCYVISAGTYFDIAGTLNTIDDALLKIGVDACEQEDEITLLTVPEAMAVGDSSRADIYNAMLDQCARLQDRFAIFDVAVDPEGTVFNDGFHFRDKNVGPDNLKYGAAYYPALKASIPYYYSENKVVMASSEASDRGIEMYNTHSLSTIDSGKDIDGNEVTAAARAVITVTAPTKLEGDKISVAGVEIAMTADAANAPTAEAAATEVVNLLNAGLSGFTAIQGVDPVDDTILTTDIIIEVDQAGAEGNTTKIDYKIDGTETDPGLVIKQGFQGGATGANKALYNAIKKELNQKKPTLYPCGTIAGVYARVDRDRGVWKAPANVSLNGFLAPSVLVTHEEQENLNVDATSGKSINAIRFFNGKGILVWGARTLAGNDNEWRYVPVRRLFIFVEESIKKATEFVVFEPNDAKTWSRTKAMISNFLTGLWREGALAGAAPSDAFFVKVGLGETMTSDDILNGIMNIEIGMAAVRPAEFIILKFSHKLQES